MHTTFSSLTHYWSHQKVWQQLTLSLKIIFQPLLEETEHTNSFSKPYHAIFYIKPQQGIRQFTHAFVNPQSTWNLLSQPKLNSSTYVLFHHFHLLGNMEIISTFILITLVNTHSSKATYDIFSPISPLVFNGQSRHGSEQNLSACGGCLHVPYTKTYGRILLSLPQIVFRSTSGANSWAYLIVTD